PVLDGWRVVPGSGPLKAGEALYEALLRPPLDPPYKAAYATALRDAPARFLHHPAVRCCLEYLRNHPEAVVREAPGWYAPPPWSLGDGLGRLHIGLRRVVKLPYRAARKLLRAS